MPTIFSAGPKVNKALQLWNWPVTIVFLLSSREKLSSCPRFLFIWGGIGHFKIYWKPSGPSGVGSGGRGFINPGLTLHFPATLSNSCTFKSLPISAQRPIRLDKFLGTTEKENMPRLKMSWKGILLGCIVFSAPGNCHLSSRKHLTRNTARQGTRCRQTNKEARKPTKKTKWTGRAAKSRNQSNQTNRTEQNKTKQST